MRPTCWKAKFDGHLIDSYGKAESVTSSATAAVTNINDAPTGGVTISGTATQGQTLTAANTLGDIDGIPAEGKTGAISYQWQADGADISGATASTFTLTQAQVGKAITVAASYTDGQGSAETVTSAATTAVANVNDAPTGSVTISGSAKQGQTLKAANTLADADELGTIGYQWLADGQAIDGATASTFKLTQVQVGKAISVKAGYTDGQGTVESVSSAATGKVANVNDAPTGGVTISGSAKQGQTLKAANTLADADGLGTIGYQWLANGQAIDGATASTFKLTQAQVGKAISVKAGYIDGYSYAESVTSKVTAKVANVNDAPTGGVTITGTAEQGQTLTASNTLADADGLGTIAYQWLADGQAIGGATASTFKLTQAQVGKAISVKAGYTDGYNYAESVTSKVTAKVANINDAPTGDVTISGTAEQGQTLTAANTLADADGLGTIAYQWLADGQAIDGATASTFKLTQAQVGKAISVKAGYTDGQGSAESQTSAATASVISTNPGVTISGSDRSTSEAGDTAVFSVKLDKAPVDPVTVQFAVSDATEARLSASSLTFTQANWNQAQTLTVTGLDDYDHDGSVAYNLSATIATNDLAYKRVTVNSIGLSNADDQWDAPIVKSGTDDIDYLRGNNGADRLYGAGNMDDLLGGRGDDRLYGQDDDDRLYGEDGNDWLYGGYDDDKLDGGNGNDELYGEAGADTLDGGAGNDTLDGGSGADSMSGGAGNDTYVVDNDNDIVDDKGAASDEDTVIVMATISYKLAANIENAELKDSSGAASLTGNALGNDLTGNGSKNTLDGGAGSDALDGGAGSDTLLGGEGADSLVGGLGNDRLDGGAGDDLIDYSDAAAGFVNVDLSRGKASGDGADTLVSIEDVIGSEGDDTLIGSNAGNELTGGLGDDTLSGGGGSDILYAGTGDDTVDAGDGDDLIIGGDGAGNDKYVGGAGIDTVKYTSATAAITVDLVKGSATSTAGKDAAKIGTDSLSGIENVIAGDYNDIVKGSTVANVLTGGLGSDRLWGGVDQVKDIFDFNAITESKTGSARDRIHDFVTEIDQIDLAGIDANTAKTGDQEFAFSGTSAKAHSVWFKVVDADGSTATKDIIVYGDVNGDAKADFEIGLVSVSSIAATDFML